MFNFRSLRSLLSASRVARRAPVRRSIGRLIEMLEDRTVPADITGAISTSDEVDRYTLNASIGDHIQVTDNTPVSHLLYGKSAPIISQTHARINDVFGQVDDDELSSLPFNIVSAAASHSVGFPYGETSGGSKASAQLAARPFGGELSIEANSNASSGPAIYGGTVLTSANAGISFVIDCDNSCTVIFSATHSSSSSGNGSQTLTTGQEGELEVNFVGSSFAFSMNAVVYTQAYATVVGSIADIPSGAASGSLSISWRIVQLVPHYGLFDPDGLLVAVDDDLADYVATKSGQYTVAVTDQGDNDFNGPVESGVDSTGDYQFTITQISQQQQQATINSYNGQYDGNAHGITATGTNGEDLSSLMSFGATYVDAGHYAVDWTFAGNTIYQPASGTSTVDITPAPLTINVGSLTKAYGETAGLFRLPTTVSTGVNGEDLGISYDSAGVGSHANGQPGGYPITATVYDDTGKIANYAITINSGTLTVDPTTALFDIDRYNDEYDGNAHGLSGAAFGVFGEDLSNLFTSFGAVYVDVGHYFADWTFGGNNNYQPANGIDTIDISRFRSIASIDSVEPLTYDGLSHGTTGQVVGINGIVLNSTVVYTDGHGNTVDGVPLHAGDYTASISFPGDNNYTFALATTHIVIAKADAVVDVPSMFVTYDGNAHQLIGTATGVQGEDLSSLLNLGGVGIDAGVYWEIWVFRGNTDYNYDIGLEVLIIDKAQPTATINAVAAATYDGHSHGTTGQVVGVKGIVLPSTITYRDDHNNLLSGAPVNAGTYTAKISFSGDDNYLAASASTIIVIGKATPTASIDPVTANYDGQRHGTTGQVVGINGVVLPSTITYRDSQNRVLNGAPVYAGVYTATISFPGNNNYTAASASTTVVILSAKDQLILLIDDVAHLGLSTGNANALTTKLNNALTKLSQGNITAGVNLMQAFINQVGAFAYSGKLSVAQADALIAAANAAIYSATH